MNAESNDDGHTYTNITYHKACLNLKICTEWERVIHGSQTDAFGSGFVDEGLSENMVAPSSTAVKWVMYSI